MRACPDCAGTGYAVASDLEWGETFGDRCGTCEGAGEVVGVALVAVSLQSHLMTMRFVATVRWVAEAFVDGWRGGGDGSTPEYAEIRDYLCWSFDVDPVLASMIALYLRGEPWPYFTPFDERIYFSGTGA